MPSVIAIVAADAKFFEMAQGAVLSIVEKPEAKHVSVAFIDLGCTPEQVQWLQQHVQFVRKVDWEFEFPSRAQTPEYIKGLLARPYLRKYLPGFDVYFWLDADAWIQDWRAVELFVSGACRRGLAIVPEIDRCSRTHYGHILQFMGSGHHWYTLAYGKETADRLFSFPLLNAGVFALHRDAPHWEEWAKALGDALQRECTFLTDQMALNYTVYARNLLDRTELLPFWCNWACLHGWPAWDRSLERMVETHLPHHPVGILHLTTQKQFERVWLPTTDGQKVLASTRYTPATTLSSGTDGITTPQFPPGDYVAPELKRVRLDAFFPNMAVGDKSRHPWPYLRREIPHNWYCDRRQPVIGFLNRDESHILYNNALQFRGRRGLEIGCWMGWSACHIAWAGVVLDVIDPALTNASLLASVTDSLKAAGVFDLVGLFPGFSPAKVEELAAQQRRRWSFFFIDGDHEGQGPLNDAITCEQLAEPDALMLLHDLNSPHVAQALDYLRQKGWNTLVYQTMQIMGVAWRGRVTPAPHRPDPSVRWSLPEHLKHFQVSGG